MASKNKSSLTLRVENLKEILDALNNTENEVRNDLQELAQQYSEKLKASAEKNVPVNTGALKSSIKASVSEAKKNHFFARVRAGQYGSGGKSPHAHLQEFGTNRHKAHPFLRPAYEQYKESFTNDVIERIKKMEIK